MSSVAPPLATAAGRADRRVTAARARRLGPLVRRPWALPVGASASAWVAYGALSRADGAGHAHHVLLAGAMAVAMMGPFAVPVCGSVARATEWRHAGRSVAAAFAAFAAVWVAAGIALHVGAEAAAAVLPAGATAAALAAWSALEAASRRRGRRLDACAVSRPILPTARLAGAADVAATAAWRCVTTCWAPMALTVVDPRPAVVAAVSVTVLAERVVTPRPRLAVTAVFVSLAVLATWGLS